MSIIEIDPISEQHQLFYKFWQSMNEDFVWNYHLFPLWEESVQAVIDGYSSLKVTRMSPKYICI